MGRTTLYNGFLAFIIGFALVFAFCSIAHAQDDPTHYGYGNSDPLQRDYCHWVDLDFCYITEIGR